jgi:hypothetical protein
LLRLLKESFLDPVKRLQKKQNGIQNIRYRDSTNNGSHFADTAEEWKANHKKE